MEFLDLAKRRYSVRTYEDRPVEQEKIDLMVEAARVAPTAQNRQPARLVIVQGRDDCDKLGKACRSHGAPLAFIVCADTERVWARALDGATSEDIDAAILTDHIMLEATDLGLGSCWICAFNPDVIAQEFDLPPALKPVNVLAVGYAAGEPASPDRHGEKRIPTSELVFARQ